MAVYTQVPRDLVESFIAEYRVGRVSRYEGVAQGVENTNYIVHVDSESGPAKYVLTLFERRVRESDIPFYLAAMAHLAAAGAPTPRPLATPSGDVIRTLCDRPAITITFLDGTPRVAPSPSDCQALGETLARMHLAAEAFPKSRPNDLSIHGWNELAKACAADADRCTPGLSALIDDELAYLNERWSAVTVGLKQGLIHADLFPDNVFFEDGQVSGVIDFYFSCTDYFAYDLAVTLNAWAQHDGAWRRENAAALLSGYHAQRSLSEKEKSALPVFLRGSALRFLLTRLYDWINQVEGAIVTVKDPVEYRDLLTFHRNAESTDLGLYDN